MLKSVLVNYNFTPTWLLDSGLDYLIYDRSDSKDYLKDFPQERIIYTENVGNVDYDKLMHLVENYDNLPEVFLWGKTNLFKYVTEEEWAKLKDNKTFTPILTQGHPTYSDTLGPVCYYSGGMYYERNGNWYANQFSSKYFQTFNEFASEFGLDCPPFIPFAPGGNYILTRETVRKYSRDLYAKMASCLPYCKLPVEACFAERAYFSLWK